MAAPPLMNNGLPIPKIWTGSDRPPGAEYVIPGWADYCLAARSRSYEVPSFGANGNVHIRAAPMDDVYAWLLTLGVDEVPHSSASADMSTIGSPEELLELGSFWDHLHGNEQVVRRWQAAAPESQCYADAVALGALMHSVYGKYSHHYGTRNQVCKLHQSKLESVPGCYI